MILNTGCRTDIPAYYSRWFYNRIKEGYVCTRNPYRTDQVLKYSPFLIGGFRDGDRVIEVRQESYINQQISLF